MKFIFTLNKESILVEQTGLHVSKIANFTLYACEQSSGFFKNTDFEINLTNIIKWADSTDLNRFHVFLHDGENHRFYAFNDKYGHNEIYLFKLDNSLVVTSEIPISRMNDINLQAAYEFLSFHSIIPPKTIYNGVEMVPLANYVDVDGKSGQYIFSRYWNIEQLFNPKAVNYKKQVDNLREVFYSEICHEYNESSAVALSGGIDSGGIIGILANNGQKHIKSISFGPYGKKSGDLESSRKTAAFYGSKNIELYPSVEMYENLFTVLPKLNQPINADHILPIAEIYRTAAEQGVSKLYFGYGTQMILGNLRLNQLWHKTRWFEPFLASSLIKIIYRLIIKLFKISGNTNNVLLADSWLERFFYSQAALYTREKGIYKQVSDSFFQDTVGFLRPIMNNQKLELSDRFVLMYLLSWTSYAQERNNAMIGKVFGITAFSPYNCPKVARVILKTPDIFRKKNKWNKQIWRDALRPYIPEHLYMRNGKSLTVPYSKIFADQLQVFLPYIEENELLKKLIDFEFYKENFSQLPEPGLNLLRLVSLGIWYDIRTDNISAVNKVRSIFLNSSLKQKTAL